MITKANMAESLRLVRVFHDVKQVELADRFGYSSSHLSEIESGKKAPTLDLILLYTEEFGIPASSLLFFAERIKQPNSARIANRAQAAISRKIIRYLELVQEAGLKSKDPS